MTWSYHLRKEWVLNGRVLLDYLAAAVAVMAFFSADSPRGFLFFGAWAASGLAVRLAGAETMFGTWEYTLTRPVPRRQWFFVRFAIGLGALVVLFALFVLGDAIGVSGLWGGALAENAPGFATAGSVSGFALSLASSIFVYALVYAFATTENRPEAVMNQRTNGLIVAALLYFVSATGIGLLLSSGPANVHHMDPDSDAGTRHLILSLIMLAGSAVCIVSALSSFVYRQVDGRDQGAHASEKSSSSLVGWVLVGLIAYLVVTSLISAAN